MILDTINAILIEAAADNCEPCLGDLHPMDAAEIGGYADEIFDVVYPWADEKAVAVDNVF